ncbi:MAG: NAD(P)-binding domain-containing protein, partial [Deltaproteobacteria bacterium]|nr:NAD(P)-binding domain-containing protein [Deltaproteobacteria bacterium]
PYLTPDFETNIKGVFIAGELGGMGLIKNAVTQGCEAVDCIARRLKEEGPSREGVYDVLIVGAGPAGIGASLNARNLGLKSLTIDQNDLGGTVLHYPRHKIVMTSPVNLPTYGKVKLRETTKEALLHFWKEVFRKTGLEINSNEKMIGLKNEGNLFSVTTTGGEYLARCMVLAIGRRGTPRKLGVPGEELPKVAYSLIDPEQHRGHALLVVGGGDSAVEAAVALSGGPGNRVTLSYRGDAFSRIKPANRDRLGKAVSAGGVKVIFNSLLIEIMEKEARLTIGKEAITIPNDYVYIFAGGELPGEFLKSIGVRIEKMFGTPRN